MSQYRVGTVDVTGSDPVVVGHGTEFLSYVTIGDLFTVLGTNVSYEVASVDNDEQITLASPYGGSNGSGVLYGIFRDFTPIVGFPYPAPGDYDTPTIIKALALRIEEQLTGTGVVDVLVDGTVSAPGIQFFNENSTGLYRPGVGQLGVAILGALVATFTAAGITLAGEVNAATIVTSGLATLNRLAVTRGAITTSDPVTITQTWNAGGVTFTGLDLNVTSTASATASLLANLRVGGTSQWKVDKSGNVTQTGTLASATQTIIGGTVTVSTPVIAATQTWNDGAVTFTGIDLNVTSTASTAASILANLRVGGTSQWKVDKSGATTQLGGITATTGALSGTLTLSKTGAAATLVDAANTTNETRLIHLGQTGTDAYIAVLSSTGGGLITGAQAYALAFRNDTGFSFGISAAEMVRIGNGSFNPANSNVLNAAIQTRANGNYGGGITILDTGISGIWTKSSGAELHLNAGGSASTGWSSDTGSFIVVPGAALIVGNSGSNSSQPTNPGFLRILGTTAAGSAVGGGGIEFRPATAGAGYGWNIMSYDATAGVVPLIIARRMGNAAWTETARFTEGGAFLVGTATDGAGGGAGQYRVSIDSGSLSQAAILKNATSASNTTVVWNASTSGDSKFIEFLTEGGGGSSRGLIDFNRGGTAVRYNTTSDQNLKIDRGVAMSALYLRDLVIHDFDWKETGHRGRGVFAQEAHGVFADAISVGDGSRPWGADYSKYVPDLIVGWQSHERQIEDLLAWKAKAAAALAANNITIN